MTKYGKPPEDLGEIRVEPKEMMFWQYCPIKLPKGSFRVPSNLCQFYPMINKVVEDLGDEVVDKYVYLTAKNLWVTPQNMGNRFGWHSDGFMSDDINYIWYNECPTVFYEPEELFEVSQDHQESLKDFEEVCTGNFKEYPVGHLLKLDQTVIHKVKESNYEGMRCFVKISVSKYKYMLEGNSINHEMPFEGPYTKRLKSRNCPITK